MLKSDYIRKENLILYLHAVILKYFLAEGLALAKMFN